MKLEHTLAWHFYKKETTILFPSPQIFETWRPATRSCPSSSSSSDLVAERPLPPSVRDCLHAGPNIDTSRVSRTTQYHIVKDTNKPQYRQTPMSNTTQCHTASRPIRSSTSVWTVEWSRELSSPQCWVSSGVHTVLGAVESSPQCWVGVVEYWVGAVETGEAQYWYQHAAQRPAWSHSYSRGSF